MTALVNTRWVAERLGMSPSWVKAAAADGRLPCVRLPGPDGRPCTLRFDPDAINAWVERLRAEASPADILGARRAT